MLKVGGNLNNAGYSGLACWNGNNDSSNANWNIVSRSNFWKRIKYTLLYPRLLAKHTTISQYGLVVAANRPDANARRGQKQS